MIRIMLQLLVVLQVQQSERDMKSLKSQLELVQQEASALQLQLSSAQDEGSSTKQEVTIVTKIFYDGIICFCSLSCVFRWRTVSN